MSWYVDIKRVWSGVLLCGLAFCGSQAFASSPDASRTYSASVANLQSVLETYRAIEQRGGWPPVPNGPALRIGSSGPAVASLRERLSITGDLVAEGGENSVFDESLSDAVARFQVRHGIDADGIVGRMTYAALNVPVLGRITQIDANLKRLQLLPDDGFRRAIIVNVARFELNVVENGKPVLAAPVIVGRLSRQTPVLSSAITKIVVNPYWTVPRRIAARDILPKVQKNPSYLTEQSIRIYRNDGPSRVEVAPDSISWHLLKPKNFGYTLVQDPGPLNALGRVKFYFPNNQDIYLHDTPARDLFRKDSRAFSSGCVRVAKALDLAKYLLSHNRESSLSTLDAALQNGKTTEIALAEPIPVHIVYLTAWVDDHGQAHFRDDIYTLDGLVDAGQERQREKLLQVAESLDATNPQACSVSGTRDAVPH